MQLFNLCEYQYCLIWEHLISFSFTLRTGHQLVGNGVTITLVCPRIVMYQNSDFSYLWQNSRSGDPDDVPF